MALPTPQILVLSLKWSIKAGTVSIGVDGDEPGALFAMIGSPKSGIEWKFSSSDNIITTLNPLGADRCEKRSVYPSLGC